MAATSVLSTDAEMLAMAGAGVSAAGFTDANKTAWGIQAEDFLCCLTNYDLVTNVATLGANFKLILSEYVSRYVGMCAIAYDMGQAVATYTSRVEAEDMINIHIFRITAIENLLLKGEMLASLGIV